MARRPTLAAVDAEAGVSTATVDRVLNSRLPVKPGTAMRVIAAAERIGYHGAALMRERVRERAPLRTLGFCLQKRSDAFYRSFARELSEAAARHRGQDCVAVVEFIDEIDPRAIARRLRSVGEVSDAVAVVAVDHPHVTDAIEELAAQGKPVFTLLSDLSAPSRAGYVGVDPRHHGRTAAWAISRLAPPSQPQAEVAVFVGSHRYLGQETCEMSFRSYLREHAPRFRVLETRVNLEDEALAYEATQELLARHPSLDGLYVAGGGIPGVVRALREHPRHVVTIITELMPERRQALVDGIVDLVLGTPIARISSTAVTVMLQALEQIERGAPPMAAAQFPQAFEIYTPENV